MLEFYSDAEIEIDVRPAFAAHSVLQPIPQANGQMKTD
jgi:hypothetical protein